MLLVTIDGRRYDLAPGVSVLDALRHAGVRIPALCHDDRLVPSGACRLCLVQVVGAPRPVAACATPLLDGMDIHTDPPEIAAFRRTALTSLARHYPADALGRFPEQPFHRCLAEHDLADTAARSSDPALRDSSHPFIVVDMARCIKCYRCVRICDEVQGQLVWHIRNRGIETEIRPDGPTLRDSSCVGCGACVDTCPTGALDDAAPDAVGPASDWTRTTCPYCGTGCEMAVGTREGRIVNVRPVLDAVVSRGHLCVKGRYAFEFVSAPDRITEPMIRTGGDWRRVSWEEAIRFTADGLRAIGQRHGADSIGVLGSARATNEENYLIQKFARAVIGTNNVDCCARVCHAPSAAALKQMLGAGLATNSFDDIERARTILLCGANATENHPIVGARIKQAVRHGARLIVIDPRRIELALYADCHLAIRPGTNVPLLNAMAHTMLAERLCDDGFVGARVADVETFRRFIESWPPDRAARVCGVEAHAIRDAARMYATERPAMAFHGLGVTEHVQGTDGVAALVNLALLTGNVGRPGGGVNPLRGQNNVQGAAHMGCEPGLLPGSQGLEAARERFEAAWKAPLPAVPGLQLLQMMDAAKIGRLKALWAVGYDVLLTNPNASETARALRSLELVIVQDLFMTSTAREAGTVFLPTCSSFEKDGTFMNAERRIQRVRRAIEPVGGSRPDWAIVCDLARAFGRGDGFQFGGVEEIWDEVRSVCDGARGMSYARLDAGGLQWPCPAEDHPGTAILHERDFAGGQRAALRSIEWHASPEETSPAFPFLLVTGRSLYQFNAATMTGRTRLVDIRPRDVLDIAPADAERVGIQEGQPVAVVSAYGRAVLPAHVSPAVRDGQLFATFHSVETLVNAVTGPHRDATVGTPEYKRTAVRLERMPTESGASAAPQG